ncbi:MULTISPECIES: peptide chain release factor 3 [Maricaulis]|jgi:peptide chain release factor 3|uniref:peptide chain release factor 3 n=1 Tax=Maricaulis TaxID=74317 RepID=UPI000C62B700|nr:peptide chain release factor 3 [Maricaulis sp.]MAC90731.1 peptide chain release factor 3 [Maricaulis sp.]
MTTPTSDAPALTSHAPEWARRRSFAIISHPDAGKTTLTETLLLSAGAIRLAGQVRARGENRRTQSDWMKIEQERGISVSASVMTFEHRALLFNLLDTPGHEDFSEDTYRTLTAADSAIMVLDAAKGVEPRTLKLVEVCRLRDIPIVTFINKMDREALDPVDLLEDIQDKLALDTVPMQWPSGSGNRFKGVLDLKTRELVGYQKPSDDRDPTEASPRWALEGDEILEHISAEEQAELDEGAEVASELCPAFKMQSFLEGHMTPVFFGSALRGFGVRELLDGLADIIPGPAAMPAIKNGQAVELEPGGKEVAGFVFKVQANMDPNHRDRVAFVRLCSGVFKRGMKLKTEAGKQLTVSSPILFFAQDREIADEAFAGDVMGVPNHGTLRVGDSLSESGKLRFSGIPNFAPEILRRARLADPLKAKHLKKALESLAEEGVTQLFRPTLGGDFIVGAVGALQIDVMRERVAAEYGLEVDFEPAPYDTARWLSGDRVKIEEFADRHKSAMAEDINGDPVFLAKSAWEVSYSEEKFPDLTFHRAKERSA